MRIMLDINKKINVKNKYLSMLMTLNYSQCAFKYYLIHLYTNFCLKIDDLKNLNKRGNVVLLVPNYKSYIS